MGYPDGDEPSPPPSWIEDDDEVDEALRDVVISYKGRGNPDDDGEDGEDSPQPRPSRLALRLG